MMFSISEWVQCLNKQFESVPFEDTKAIKHKKDPHIVNYIFVILLPN